ncbi:hypothetical protein [Streptomyces virginiae]|uniref:hypothetical protein n=1 Tax=Streptomyces virginiae TaxID=1961 RepID=UPI003418BCBE
MLRTGAHARADFGVADPPPAPPELRARLALRTARRQVFARGSGRRCTRRTRQWCTRRRCGCGSAGRGCPGAAGARARAVGAGAPDDPGHPVQRRGLPGVRGLLKRLRALALPEAASRDASAPPCGTCDLSRRPENAVSIPEAAPRPP